jgi:hypothetical protein
MKVELKSVKVCHWASEETNCFTATMWIDGKKAGRADNDGKGGSTNLSFFDPKVRVAFEAFAKAQPPIPGFHGSKIEMDAELYIDLLVDAHIKEKDEQRIQKTALKEKERMAKGGYLALQLHFGENYLWVGVKSEAGIPAAIEAMKKKYKFETCESALV